MSTVFIMLSVAVFVSVVVVAAAIGEKHWALLVAGSNDYINYRHQADICHAYHIVRNHGIPDERIIVMMYDDIVNNTANPVKGNIINQPGGPNVYPGVVKDYTGEEVTAEVFLKVLTGDAEGIKKTLGREGKVINSGPDDHIFVNFVDHGSPGLLLFPNDYLMADDLHKAIKQMYTQKRYKQMVFYIEACHSGSMFSGLLENNINVYATTAASSNETSFACFLDDTRDTYLGDVYSVNWMFDSEKENLNHETLGEQFMIVKRETKLSHVQEYGDLKKMGSLKLGDFQGNLTSKMFNSAPLKYHPTLDAVPSEDVAMYILKRKLLKASGNDATRHRSALQDLMQQKMESEEFFREIVGAVTKYSMYVKFLHMPVAFTDFSCYRESLRLVQEMCPGLRVVQNDYALKKLSVLANMCESDIPHKKIWAAIGKVASESRICGQTQ